MLPEWLAAYAEQLDCRFEKKKTPTGNLVIATSTASHKHS